MGLSIVLPTFNERENVSKIVDLIRSECEKRGIEFEIVIVDDDSPDRTWEVAQHLSSKDRRIKVIRRIGERGLASAIVKGILSSSSERIVVMDADLSHDWRLLGEMYEKLSIYDVVVASRYAAGGGCKDWPLYRRILSKGATLMAKKLLGINVSDPLSGFFGIRKEAFSEVRDILEPRGFKILLEILAKGSFKVGEVPFVFRGRVKGKSKLDLGVISAYIMMLLKLLAFKLRKK